MKIAGMVSIIRHEQLQFETRSNAMEALLTLCESKPGLMKKQHGFVDTILGILVNWIGKVEDVDQSWLTFCPDSVTENESEWLSGETGLDRLSLSLGSCIVTPLFAIIGELTKLSDWRAKYTAVTILGQIAEGSGKGLRKKLDDCFTLLNSLVSDSHPRVKWAVANTVGLFFTGFGNTMNALIKQKALDIVFKLLTDSVPRVQANAALAIVNYCDSCSHEDVVNNLVNLVECLKKLLTVNDPNILEAVVTALSRVAEASAANFMKYYDTFVPYLKAILRAKPAPEQRLLQGKAMECVTTIGVAVGSTMFKKDVNEIVDLMLAIQQSVGIADPQNNYIEASFGRIAECLGAEFGPFLDRVIGGVIARAQIQPEIRISSRGMQHDAGWTSADIGGDTEVQLHTSQVEEKEDAFTILLVYAENTKEFFAQHAEQVSKLIADNISFKHSEHVRCKCASLVPDLIECVLSAFEKNTIPRNNEMLFKMWSFLLNAVLRALSTEMDITVADCLVTSISLSLKALGNGALTPELLDPLISTLSSVFNDWVVRYRDSDRGALLFDEDEDEETLEQRMEENSFEDSLCDSLVNLGTKILETSGKVALPFIMKYLAPIIVLLYEDQNPQLVQKAYLFTADIFDYCWYYLFIYLFIYYW